MGFMKRTIGICFALLASWGAKAQYVSVSSETLTSAYAALAEKNNQENRQAFFDAFPKNWMEYITTYQYGSALYGQADRHVRALGEMAGTMAADAYCKRLVDLCIGGELDADAPNYLRALVMEVLQKDDDCRKGIFSYLSKLRRGHRFQFWFFCLSNIVRSSSFEGEFARLNEYAKNCCPEEAEIMADAYKYAYDGVNFVYDGYGL